MKILVTGGAGFIGSHLVDRLVQEGHAVVVVDNLSTGKRAHLNTEAAFYKVDITSQRLNKIFQKEKPEVVSHHAAQMDPRLSMTDPVLHAQNNIVGMVNLLECAMRNGTRRIVFASSGSTLYGDQGVLPLCEEEPTHPLSPYGVGKLTGEHYLHYYKNICGLEYTSLRYATVYGPRQDPSGESRVIARFAQTLLQGEQPIIDGNGMQTSDYLFVDDVVEANIAVLHSHLNDTYNVGTGVETSVEQLFHLLTDIIGSTMKPMYGPGKQNELMRNCLSFQKINKAFDWEPKESLRSGLAKTVDYFREAG